MVSWSKLQVYSDVYLYHLDFARWQNENKFKNELTLSDLGGADCARSVFDPFPLLDGWW